MTKKDIFLTQKPQFGNKRSKALNATPRKWCCNMQRVKIKQPDGTVITTKISARAKRTQRKKGTLV